MIKKSAPILYLTMFNDIPYCSTKKYLANNLVQVEQYQNERVVLIVYA